MSQSRKIAKNIFSLSIAEFANKGIAFFTGAYLARTIFNGYGAVGTITACFLFFNLVVNLGFNNVGTREISKAPEMIKKYVNSIISIRFLLAIITYASLIIFSFYWNQSAQYKLMLQIYGLSLFASAFLLDWYYQGVERMEILGIRQLLTGIINFAMTLLFVKNYADTVNYIIIITATSLINTLWMLLLYVKQNGGFKFEYDKELWKSIMKSSLPIAISLASVAVLNYLNMIMMTGFRPLDFEYQNNMLFSAFRIATFAIMPSAIFQGAFYPLLSRSEKGEDRRKTTEKYHITNGFVGAILTTSVVSFSWYIVYLAYGAKYLTDCPYTLAAFAVANIFGVFNVSNITPLIAWKQEKLVMRVIIFGGVIVNTGGNLILIPGYGALGAAFSNIASEIAISIGLSYYLYKFSGKVFILPYFKFYLPAIVSCIIGVIVSKLIGFPPVGIVISGALYAILVYQFKLVDFNEIKGLIKR